MMSSRLAALSALAALAVAPSAFAAAAPGASGFAAAAAAIAGTDAGEGRGGGDAAWSGCAQRPWLDHGLDHGDGGRGVGREEEVALMKRRTFVEQRVKR